MPTASGTKKIELPVYTYPFEMRLKAAGVLKGKGVSPDWGYLERKELAKALKAHMETVLGRKLKDDIDVTSYERPVAKWLIQYQEIMAALED